MKSTLKLITCLIIVLTGLLSAANINLSNVSSDAQWFSHFDIEQFNNSELRKLADERGLADKCVKMQQYLGIDPSEAIKSMTLYSTSSNPEDATAILKGDFQVENIVDLAKNQPEHALTQYGDFTIHSWQSHKEEMKSGCFYDGSTLIMAKSTDTIISTIKTLEGKTPSLADSGCTTSEDAIFQLFIQDVSSLSQKSKHLMFLNNVGQSLFALGQKNNDLFCEMIMQTDTAENGELLGQMMQGMVAMGKMAAAEKKREVALDALKTVYVNQQDTTVITTMVLTTEQFKQIMDTLTANKDWLSKVCGQFKKHKHM